MYIHPLPTHTHTPWQVLVGERVEVSGTDQWKDLEEEEQEEEVIEETESEHHITSEEEDDD